MVTGIGISRLGNLKRLEHFVHQIKEIIRDTFRIYETSHMESICFLRNLTSCSVLPLECGFGR